MRLSLLCLGMLFGWSYAQPAVVWKQAAEAELIVPELSGPTAHIVENTINE